jgi:hypothetical protein
MMDKMQQQIMVCQMIARVFRDNPYALNQLTQYNEPDPTIDGLALVEALWALGCQIDIKS